MIFFLSFLDNTTLRTFKLKTPLLLLLNCFHISCLLAGEPVVVEAMKTFAELTDQAR